MAFEDELTFAANAATAFAAPDEIVEAVLAAEPATGVRVYVCAFTAEERRAWLVLDATGAAVTSRALVREAVSIAALCEIAGEAAGDPPPRLASPSYLDSVGSAEIVAGALAAVDSLTQDVESAYKVELG